MANFQIRLGGGSLLGRILVGTAALVVVVLLFFFLAAALVLGSVLGAVFLARLWWLKRSLKQPEQPGVITAEYTVIEREPQEPPRLPDGTRPASRQENQP